MHVVRKQIGREDLGKFHVITTGGKIRGDSHFHLKFSPAHLSRMCGPCWVCGDSFRAVSLGPTMERNGGTEPDMALAWDASSTGA